MCGKVSEAERILASFPNSRLGTPVRETLFRCVFRWRAGGPARDVVCTKRSFADMSGGRTFLSGRTRKSGLRHFTPALNSRKRRASGSRVDQEQLTNATSALLKNRVFLKILRGA